MSDEFRRQTRSITFQQTAEPTRNLAVPVETAEAAVEAEAGAGAGADQEFIAPPAYNI